MRTAPTCLASWVGIVVMTLPIALASQTASDFLDRLTVTGRLPDGCSLTSGRMSVGLSQITANPWHGTDRAVIASIREAMYGPPRLPDGPPLDADALSRFLVRLSEGIDEGYAAFYSQKPAEDVAVFALRFSNHERVANRRNSARTDSSPPTWFEKGTAVVVLYGDSGPCARAIRTHLESRTR